MHISSQKDKNWYGYGCSNCAVLDSEKVMGDLWSLSAQPVQLTGNKELLQPNLK